MRLSNVSNVALWRSIEARKTSGEVTITLQYELVAMNLCGYQSQRHCARGYDADRAEVERRKHTRALDCSVVHVAQTPEERDWRARTVRPLLIPTTSLGPSIQHIASLTVTIT